ncbi:MAG: hypothetical protein ACI36V_08725 [Coriobacteriales bacterium]
MELVEELAGRDARRGYQLMLEFEPQSFQSDALYCLFDEFVDLTEHPSSIVRTRGFRLAVAQARWDEQGKIATRFGELAAMLHDGKPTAVRQCLSALHRAVELRPQLAPLITAELDRIDVSKYAPSMAPLIAQDVAALRERIGERATPSRIR